MKTISIFNNKGGVGKTTLTFHLAHALAEMGHRTLIVDLDPQCNLTILAMEEEKLHQIWLDEDPYIDDFQGARDKATTVDFDKLVTSQRSIHFLLKPSEDGTSEIGKLPPPQPLATNLDLIPGRLSMHLYEDKIASRWSDVYQGDPLAIRTLTKPREIAEAYAAQHGYEFVIMDTSPSLGALNKVLISTTDGFLIPCMPDMFSLYGIRNIGNALSLWKKQFETIYQLLSVEKRKAFPNKFVRLLGFTIFNAKKYTNKPQPKLWNLAQAHFTYAKQLPVAIKDFIPLDIRNSISAKDLSDPIGGMAVMHSHNTMPSTSQRYHLPMWKVPSCGILEFEEESTIRGNRAMYENTQDSYKKFATSVLERLSALD